jgi:hypothetical protein
MQVLTTAPLSPPSSSSPHRCEMGLDPGMDHMSAVELIERAHALGGVVTSFTSNCGGLPSPEVASTTPFGYKFSWSPAGVIAATRNVARASACKCSPRRRALPSPHRCHRRDSQRRALS